MSTEHSHQCDEHGLDDAVSEASTETKQRTLDTSSSSSTEQLDERTTLRQVIEEGRWTVEDAVHYQQPMDMILVAGIASLTTNNMWLDEHPSFNGLPPREALRWAACVCMEMNYYQTLCPEEEMWQHDECVSSKDVYQLHRKLLRLVWQWDNEDEEEEDDEEGQCEPASVQMQQRIERYTYQACEVYEACRYLQRVGLYVMDTSETKRADFLLDSVKLDTLTAAHNDCIRIRLETQMLTLGEAMDIYRYAYNLDTDQPDEHGLDEAMREASTETSDRAQTVAKLAELRASLCCLQNGLDMLLKALEEIEAWRCTIKEISSEEVGVCSVKRHDNGGTSTSIKKPKNVQDVITPHMRAIIERARSHGWIEDAEDGRLKWMLSKAALSYLVTEVYNSEGLKRTPYKALGQLFGVSRLDAAFQSTLGTRNKRWEQAMDSLLRQ